MDAHLSPQRKARRARRMRREEAAWARRASDVDTRVACVCDRHPETCRAEHHTSPAADVLNHSYTQSCMDGFS